MPIFDITPSKIALFRPKAALNYPSTKNRDQCLCVCHRFLPVLSFWPYSILTISSEPNEKPRKILSVLKIFFSSSGKNLTDSKDISDDSRDSK